MAISLPIGGIDILKDINIGADRSPPIKIQAEIVAKEIRTHRGRKGRVSYSYHLTLNQIDSDHSKEIILPDSVRVENGIFKKFKEHDRAEFLIGLGKLNHPWIQKINRLDADTSY